MTEPVRTLLDLAAVASPDELARALNEAQVRRLVTARPLRAAIRPGTRGAARLKALLDGTPAPTRSDAERRMLTLVAAAHLPRPETNVTIAGHEIDVLWRKQRLAVEIDGFTFHHTRRSFEHDRRRDAEVLAHAGVSTMRVTWRQIAEEPEGVVARLAAALVGGGEASVE